jgi:hypothetical protein
MSPLEFRDAVRAETQLLVLLAGGTGTGKTESALRIATGIAGETGTIVAIDTERGRMLHKADDYRFLHATLEGPFSPERYVEAIVAAEALDPAVIVIDSGSHEYDGEGGVLDLQLEEHARLGGGENTKLLSWARPKQRHKRYVAALLRARPHVIVCHRAEDKVDIVKVGGRTEVVPKQSYTGAGGWIPICERRLPFEATLSVVLTPDNPGVPVPVKLERRFEEIVPLDRQLDEDTGRRLAAWAAGDKTGAAVPSRSSGDSASPRSGAGDPPLATDVDVGAMLELAKRVGPDEHRTASDAVDAFRAKHGGKVSAEWLEKMVAALDAMLPDDPAELGQPAFPIPDEPRGSMAYREEG